MKRWLLDIIACPIDKNSLELREFESNGEEVVEGVLICLKCNRIYPIVQGIPILLQEELRDKEIEQEFMERWKDEISKIINNNNN
jgi:uncharacterized protein YbaR (Trm112 family)